MSSDTLVLCPCGEYHPLGFVCEKVQHMEKHSTDKHGHSSHDHKHKHEGSCCSHSHNHHVHEDCQDHIHNHVHEGSCCGHTHEHKHETCCGHEHATPQDIDWKTVGEASATRAVYRIVNMDCPMEEALIRTRFPALPGWNST